MVMYLIFTVIFCFKLFSTLLLFIMTRYVPNLGLYQTSGPYFLLHKDQFSLCSMIVFNSNFIKRLNTKSYKTKKILHLTIYGVFHAKQLKTFKWTHGCIQILPLMANTSVKLWTPQTPHMPEALSQTGHTNRFPDILLLHAVWCQPFSLNSLLLCSCSIMKRCLIHLPRMHWEMSPVVNRLSLTTCGDPARQWSHSHVNNSSNK